MSFSNTAETAVLNQVFVGTALPWNANTDLWLALHTSDPGEAGSAITNEVSTGAWTNYARIALARATDFDVSGDTVSNANLEQFSTSSGGTGATVTHVSIVTTASGAGTIIARAALNSSLVVGTGVQPQFNAGALTFTLN
jgi:hypothetical protein